jgi:iron complex outermembrane receptor protein
VLLECFSRSNRKAATNYFLQADFSLSEKLHLETGLAFNTTLFLRDLFCRAISLHLLGSSITRAGLSYSFTKTNLCVD